MFVFLKVAEILVAPLNLVLYALLAALILPLFGRNLLAHRLIQLAVGALLALAVLPWSNWLVAPLEERFPPPSALPDQVDGVVVLGGAVNPVMSAARHQPNINGAAERLFALLELGRRYPQARIVFSSGTGSIARPDLKEAPVVRGLLDSAGFDTTRVIFENQSRNTWENAVFSRDLALPRPGQTWLLVTSAMHMPRSVGAFRAAGWQVVPYPVDYQTSGERHAIGLNLVGGGVSIHAALHEWLGLAYYRARGWSDSWYPAL